MECMDMVLVLLLVDIVVFNDSGYMEWWVVILMMGCEYI
jgi:hypothetical protein